MNGEEELQIAVDITLQRLAKYHANSQEIDRRDPLELHVDPRVRMRVQVVPDGATCCSLLQARKVGFAGFFGHTDFLQLVLVDSQSQGRRFESFTARARSLFAATRRRAVAGGATASTKPGRAAGLRASRDASTGAAGRERAAAGSPAAAAPAPGSGHPGTARRRSSGCTAAGHGPASPARSRRRGRAAPARPSGRR